jgi:hypothetical protein
VGEADFFGDVFKGDVGGILAMDLPAGEIELAEERGLLGYFDS